MKTYSTIAALSLASVLALAATGTHAQEATYELPQPVMSSVSRADVKAQVLQARAEGTLVIGEAGWPAVTFAPQRTRAEVRAETLAAIASGELRELNREPYGSSDRFVSGRTNAASVMASAGR